jgi:hypothetical protein
MVTAYEWEKCRRGESGFVRGTSGHQHAFPDRMRQTVIGTQNERGEGNCLWMTGRCRSVRAFERGGRAAERGSRMADLEQDDQVLSGHAAEATEIQQAATDGRSEPDLMRWIKLSGMKHGKCVGPGESTSVSVRWCDRQRVAWTVREKRNTCMSAHMDTDHGQWRCRLLRHRQCRPGRRI